MTLSTGVQDAEKPGAILELNVTMEAPNITMPRNSDSKDAVHLDLGSFSLSNAVAWRRGDSFKDPQVILPSPSLAFHTGLKTSLASLPFSDSSKGNFMLGMPASV